MTPTRWQEIERVYHAALDRPPADRAAFLAEICKGDPELRREVESLLAQDSSRTGTLDRPASAGFDSSAGGASLIASGTQLGPYNIEVPLGAGGMGQVYKARDTRLGRAVAIKIANQRFSDRFEREARAISSLNHPHICTLYDIGPSYLVMELVEGETLAERLKKGALPVGQVLDYGAQIADALAAAHAKGITHRDLKPGNIMLTKSSVKVLDFGLAKSTKDETLTGSHVVLGTPAYMAPEQREGKDCDARTDIYALGLILQEMATGARTSVPKLDLPAELSRIIQTCLEVNPEERWQSARDLQRELEWAATPVAIPHKRTRLPWAAAAVLAMIAAVAVGTWTVLHSRRPPVEERSLRLQIAAPEGARFAFGNAVGGVALSPDGMSAAFVTSGSDKNGLWVEPLDGTPARLLPETEGALSPFWSPDNKSIAFFTTDRLKRVDLAGGLPLEICDVALGNGGVWLENGQILFGTFFSGLFKVPASGGTPSSLTTLDASLGEHAHEWPQALPGGRFLYKVQSEKPENLGIYAASFAEPTERVRLLSTNSNALYAQRKDGKSYLLWLRGVTLFAQELKTETLKLTGEPYRVADPVSAVPMDRMNAAVSPTGLLLYSDSNTSTQFAWIDRAGKTLGAVGDPGYYSTFRLSPDGRRVAANRDIAGTADLWLLDVERGVSSRFTSGGISGSAPKFFPVWSPDRRTVVFVASGSWTLFRKESGGTSTGTEQRVLAPTSAVAPTDWSRDGRFILYTGHPPRAYELWILPVTPDGHQAAGTEPRPYLRTQFNERYGRFSPENSPHWVAYQSDETGRYEVYIQAFPEPHGATQISTNGGQYPQWSPDGRELFYVSQDYKLMVVSLKLGAGSVQPSAPRELFRLPAFNLSWEPYEVAPDGQRFLVRAMSQQPSRPLTVIVNWPALLKKAAP